MRQKTHTLPCEDKAQLLTSMIYHLKHSPFALQNSNVLLCNLFSSITFWIKLPLASTQMMTIVITKNKHTVKCILNDQQAKHKYVAFILGLLHCLEAE